MYVRPACASRSSARAPASFLIGVWHWSREDFGESRKVECPLFLPSTAGRREAYAEKYRAFVGAYIVASAAYRTGELGVEFPLCSYRPPWLTPRLLAA
jgi:hypothetical protein